MGSIPMTSDKTAWVGSIEWTYASGSVTATLYTWKTDGYPSSSSSGGNFTATVTVGSTTRSFSFQQQEKSSMKVGSVTAAVSGNAVTISARVDAPYGVSMYGYPLTGSQTVKLYEENTDTENITPSYLSLSSYRAQMGEDLLISIIPSRLDVSHRLFFSVNDGDAYFGPFGDLGTSYVWRIPDLMAYCSDKLSCRVKIWCDTYSALGNHKGQTYVEFDVCAYPETQPGCAGTVDMGNTLAITLPRQTSQYVHDLTYTFEGTTGAIGQGFGAACEWVVPLQLAKNIPSQTAANCTVTCVTRWGNTEIGRRTFNVLLKVPDNDLTKPTGEMFLSPAGDVAERFAGMYIRGVSAVEASFTARSEYSQVSHCQIVVEGTTVTGNPARSAQLHSHGSVTVTGRIVDKRGYVRTLSQNIPVIAYDKPRVIPYSGESAIVAVRCDYPDGTRNVSGQSLLIRAGRKYTAMTTQDGQLNFCSLSYRYKPAAADAYSDYYDLIDEGDLSGDFVSIVVENAVEQLKSGYTVQLRAQDSLGSFSVITVAVPALAVPFHIGKGNTNVAVGKYCDYSRENAFEMGLTAYFDTGIALRPIFAAGSWSVGAELGSEVASADASAISLYTLFIGVCAGEPVWLMKLGNRLYGDGVKITSDGSVITLDAAPAPVTGLYAVL